MRIFTASFATETNTFSPVPTDRASFDMAFYAAPGQHPATPTLCSAPMVVLRRRAIAEGFDLVEGTATWAEPGGLLQRQTFEDLRDQILDELRAAMPVDGVVLGLHGAMVAQGYDDCEGDFLERIRALVGPDVLVAAELDPHSHLTPKRVANADILAAFLEFPHTDFVERAEHVVDLALRTLRGEIKPSMASFDCRMVGVFPTSREPMRSFVDRMKAMQGRDGILSISLIHGFMAADVPELGTRMLVITDSEPAKAAEVAKRLGLEIFALRGTTAMPMLETEAGLDRAVALSAAASGKPVVVADVWDNPGGGVAGDGTLILRRILDRQIDNVAVATIWDPMAVTFCLAAGEGARLMLRFGGKAGPDGGAPIDADVTVLKAVPEGWQSFGASRVTLGATAVIRIEGTAVEVILNTNRTQTFEPDIFSNLGIDPAAKAILLVKSTNHFHAGFAPVAAEIIYIDAGAPYPSDPRRTVYRKLTRPLWPRVDDPHGSAG
ncbi:M81 family metallopeptidase [Lichenihabitans sp. PAMC28606]|uniref:M81 family metallopeptidase n=1 Tax=Lichenihabitans sp. PAMC28606 TaxID=2880932 RepID=UPI001D09C98D|nr:M81 family metallopeptidase [Lichenihabitans sp. PAMC28606]UDL94465.1 M81 family metallopeptidase [Lichenihabitans sp. PAMC28606]